ncbi:MAG: hypothetical protein LBQ59_03910 [Candidatus Peribacteria bacterium]|nr:hypothetical protein [Candidatus Peribacteria bacterium]
MRPQFEAKQTEKEDLEAERQKLIEEFELKLKQEKYQDLLHPEKWEHIQKKDKNERTQDEQTYRSEIRKQLKDIIEARENDEEIEKVTEKLN